MKPLEKQAGPAFALHPQLEKDTVFVAELSLCRVQLMNDSRYPWLVLVPRREGVSEVFQLDARDRHRLIEETAQVSALLNRMLKPAKINVAALGNVVPQLHMHVVARRTGDEAWPNPVWGRGEAVKYDEKVLNDWAEKLSTVLKEVV